MTEYTDPDSPGDGEPNEQDQQLVFTLQLGRQALDDICRMVGLVPTNDIRLTIAQELNNQAIPWMGQVVHQVALTLQKNN